MYTTKTFKRTKSFGINWLAALIVGLLTACHAGHDHGPDEHADETTHADGKTKEEAHAHGSDEIIFSPEQAKAAGLQIETVKPMTFTEVVEVSGQILPAPGTESTIVATMAGIVNYATAGLTDGKAVRAGQPLFVINAKSMADGNPAAVAQAELNGAQRAWERAQRMAKDHIISQRELDEARLRYESAKATALSLGNANQTRKVGATLNGYLKGVAVKPGDYVTAGQPLATVTQNRTLQLRADVPERHYAFLPRITSANFRMAYGDRTACYSLKELNGKLLSKGQATATGEYFIPVTFELENRGDFIPGSLAQVYLIGAPRAEVLTLPLSALTEAQGLHFAYLQLHADAYRRVEVQLGASDGRRVEILHGIKAGDKVVTQGATQVRLAASATVIPEGHSH